MGIIWDQIRFFVCGFRFSLLPGGSTLFVAWNITEYGNYWNYYTSGVYARRGCSRDSSCLPTNDQQAWGERVQIMIPLSRNPLQGPVREVFKLKSATAVKFRRIERGNLGSCPSFHSTLDIIQPGGYTWHSWRIENAHVPHMEVWDLM